MPPWSQGHIFSYCNGRYNIQTWLLFSMCRTCIKMQFSTGITTSINTIAQVKKLISSDLEFHYQKLRDPTSDDAFIRGQISAYERMAKQFGVEVSLRVDVNWNRQTVIYALKVSFLKLILIMQILYFVQMHYVVSIVEKKNLAYPLRWGGVLENKCKNSKRLSNWKTTVWKKTYRWYSKNRRKAFYCQSYRQFQK